MIVKLRRKNARYPDLTPGQEYAVLGVEADDFRLLNDRGQPYLYPHQLFDVVDPLEPEDWVIEVGEDSERYAYPPPLNACGFFEDFFDAKRKAVVTFWQVANQRLGTPKGHTFMTSSDYERLVLDLIAELTHASEVLGSPLIAGGRQNKITGASSFPHQIDVSIKTDRAFFLFECKYWTDPVDVEPVLVIASRLADIRVANPELEVAAGIVSTKPATSGAQVVARYFGIQLDVVSTPREYALRIRERFFLGRSDSLAISLVEHATVVKRDIS